MRYTFVIVIAAAVILVGSGLVAAYVLSPN
jgi:hypothetical protein